MVDVEKHNRNIEIDATNKFMVGMNGDSIVVVNFERRMSKKDALNLAAWIVALADPMETEFVHVFRKVLET
jgi:hypothetical protein